MIPFPQRGGSGNAMVQLAETQRDVIIVQVSACAQCFELTAGSDRDHNMNLESKIDLDGGGYGLSTAAVAKLPAVIRTPAVHLTPT